MDLIYTQVYIQLSKETLLTVEVKCNATWLFETEIMSRREQLILGQTAIVPKQILYIATNFINNEETVFFREPWAFWLVYVLSTLSYGAWLFLNSKNANNGLRSHGDRSCQITLKEQTQKDARTQNASL